MGWRERVNESTELEMRLLFVTQDEYPPFRADVVELFARQMPARGHQIDWLMQAPGLGPDDQSPIRWLGNTVHVTRLPRRKGLAGKILRNFHALLGDLYVIPLAFRNRYDAIQVRDRFTAGILGLVAARLTGARYFYWMSYPFAESKLDQVRNGYVAHPRLVWLKAQVMRLLLYRIILPGCDHAFVQSERMREDCTKQGVDPEKMTPVPMGIHAAQVGSAEAALAPDTAAPVLLHLGLLLRLRQTEMLVRVLERVRRRYPGARLLYVGDGQEPGDRRAVEDEARRLGLSDAVEITGFLPMEQAWQHVERADICFSPYYPIPVLQSTSPTKLIEYMAMAKCIVANHHPEQTPIMADSGVGSTVPWDEDAFANNVIELLDDPAEARRRASLGPQWVRRHRTYDVIADAVEARYAELIAAPGARASTR
jgi:glycosyltransferase involved in cell wall biosynthesis